MGMNISRLFFGHKLRRFILSGVGVLALSLVFTYLLTEKVGLYYLTSYIIVLTVSTLVNFILGSRFVFKTQEKHLPRFIYYLLALGLFYLADIGSTRALTDIIGLHYSISITLSKMILFFVKFILYDRVLFTDTSFLYGRRHG